MEKEINYVATTAMNDIRGRRNGNPLDSDLFYDDMGATMEFSNACGCEMKSGADAATVQAGLTAAGQIAGAFSQGKSDVKQACGARPVLAKNRSAYDNCVKKYNAGTLKGKQVQTKDGTSPVIVAGNNKPKDNTGMYAAITVGVLVVAGIWYFKKK